MLGEGAAALGQRAESAADGRRPRPSRRPASSARQLSDDRRLRDATFDLYPGEVLGVVALEGQGQDELFDILSGAERPASGLAARRRQAGLLPPPGGRDPDGRRLRRGRPCRGAADAALGAREHLAAVLGAHHAAGAGSTWAARDGRSTRPSRRSRSTPAPAARCAACRAATSRRSRSRAGWRAASRRMLCFDPTRGIDIRHQDPDLRAAARPGRGRRGDPAVHLGAEGDPARLRPGHRHLRRRGGRRDAGGGRRRGGPAARRAQPQAGRRAARGGRRRGDRPRRPRSRPPSDEPSAAAAGQP